MQCGMEGSFGHIAIQMVLLNVLLCYLLLETYWPYTKFLVLLELDPTIFVRSVLFDGPILTIWITFRGRSVLVLTFYKLVKNGDKPKPKKVARSFSWRMELDGPHFIAFCIVTLSDILFSVSCITGMRASSNTMLASSGALELST